MAYYVLDGDASQHHSKSYNGRQASSRPPQSQEEFLRLIRAMPRVSIARNLAASSEDPVCLVCSDALPPSSRAAISRRCRCDSYPCEGAKPGQGHQNLIYVRHAGHVCRCKDFECCFDCVAIQLWNSTGSVMRNSGRWRAKCVRISADSFRFK